MAALKHFYFAPANRQIGEAPTSPQGGAFCATQGPLARMKRISTPRRKKALQIVAGLFSLVNWVLTLSGIHTECAATRIGQQQIPTCKA